MTNANLPPPDRIRVLLTDTKLTPADIDRYGDQFWDAGVPNVAIMFWDRTRNSDRVQRVIERALKDGDAFLLEWAARTKPEAVTQETWAKCAGRAGELKKHAFARSAWSRAGDVVKAEEANQALLKMMGEAPRP